MLLLYNSSNKESKQTWVPLYLFHWMILGVDITFWDLPLACSDPQVPVRY